MKNTIACLLSCLFTLGAVFPLSSEIIETNEIRDISQYSPDSSLILFNLSRTLYLPSSTMSNNRWRMYFDEQVKQYISDRNEAESFINKIKNMIVRSIPKKAIEQDVDQLIAGLQNQKFPVLGITRKFTSPSYADNFDEITYHHLLSLGIDFNKTLQYLTLASAEDNTSQYAFRYGILFTNKQPEGPAIIAFMKRLDQLPKKIVMIDNSYESLASVEASLKPFSIDFIGLRYGRCDEENNNFDPDIGTIQFIEYMKNGSILSDEEARSIKMNHEETNFEAWLKCYILNKTVNHMIESP